MYVLAGVNNVYIYITFPISTLYTTSFHTTSLQTAPYIPFHIAPYCSIPLHTAPHHFTPPHITPHHLTLHIAILFRKTRARYIRTYVRRYMHIPHNTRNTCNCTHTCIFTTKSTFMSWNVCVAAPSLHSLQPLVFHSG